MATIDTSTINTLQPVDGTPAGKGNLRANLAAIKTALNNAKDSIDLALGDEAISDFAFDGTDESATLQALITADLAGSVTHRKIIAPRGGTLGLSTSITINNTNARPYVLDLSRVPRIKRLGLGVDINVTGAAGASFTVNSDITAGDTLIDVSTDPTSDLAQGDWVIVSDTTVASDIQGGSSNTISTWIRRVQAVTTSTVTVDQPIDIDMATTDTPTIVKIVPSKNVTIIAPEEDEYTLASSTAAAYSFTRAVNCRLIKPFLNDKEVTNQTDGALVYGQYCDDIAIFDASRIGEDDGTVAGAGQRYGMQFESCRNIRITDSLFTRCRYGIVLDNCTDIYSIGNTYRDCMVGGFKTRGSCTFRAHSHGDIFQGGGARASDITTQSGVIIGDATVQAGDKRIFVTEGAFTGFTDAIGAVQIHLPCGEVYVSNAYFMDCLDGIRTVETGTLVGGDLAFGDLYMASSTGYAVNDATITNGFADIKLGIVTVDSDAAGEISTGATGAASRPDIVDDKGQWVLADSSVSSTSYDITASDTKFQNSTSTFDRTVKRLIVGSPDATARTFNLPAGLDSGSEIEIAIPYTQTGTVTIGLQAGAAFTESGATSYDVLGQPGADDWRIIECCVQNDGKWRLTGDIDWTGIAFPYNVIVDGDFAITGNLQYHGREEETITATTDTLVKADMGLVKLCDAASANQTITIDNSSGVFRGGSVTIWNLSTTYTVTIDFNSGANTLVIPVASSSTAISGAVVYVEGDGTGHLSAIAETT